MSIFYGKVSRTKYVPMATDTLSCHKCTPSCYNLFLVFVVCRQPVLSSVGAFIIVVIVSIIIIIINVITIAIHTIVMNCNSA